MYYHGNIMRKLLCCIFIIIFSVIYFDTFGAESEPFRQGLSLYAKGEFEMAALRLEEAKNIESRNPRTYFYLGNVYFQLNQLDQAIINYSAGLSFAENKGDFFYNLGNCYYEKENYLFATDMYSKAVEHNGELVDAHLHAGMAFYQAGDYPNTISQWETYLNKYPHSPQYDEVERAIALLKGKATETSPESGVGPDQELMDEVLSDLDSLVDSTENIMEGSEQAVDDLSIEGIER
jgi:tetratricopeptide (TPR) repeat protein